MTAKTGKLGSFLIFIVFIGSSIALVSWTKPTTVAAVQPEVHTPEFQRAFFEASKVYGKAGCGNQELAEMTAKRALETGLPPQLIASMAASESTCNPLAISNRGAVGLMQPVPKLWSKEFDFTKINLFNPEDNMFVSTSILSKLVKQYGLRNGLLHYYGTGSDGIGLGGEGYAQKVLALAGKL